MAKQDNTIFWIIGIVIVLLLVGINFGIFDFVITGNEQMSRTYSSMVNKGSTLAVTYSVSGASGKWGASVIDTLSCPGYSSQEKRFVIISDEGTSKIVNYNIPNAEGIICTFSGDYKFGDKATKTFISQTVQTKITCKTEADLNCDGVIDRTELGAYIDKWVNNQITRDKLGEIIQAWAI